MSHSRAPYHTTKPAELPRLSEAKLQQQCVQWFTLQHPTLILYANVNHGKRSKKAGYLEKLAGLTPGLPDLTLAALRGGYGGFYIELKAEGGRLSIHQTHMLAALEVAGYCCQVCYDFDAFKAAVTRYLSLAPITSQR